MVDVGRRMVVVGDPGVWGVARMLDARCRRGDGLKGENGL